MKLDQVSTNFLSIRIYANIKHEKREKILVK